MSDDERSRALREYMAAQEAARLAAEAQRAVTGQFPLVPQDRPVFQPVERPRCQDHSGVCVAFEGLKARVDALEIGRRDNRGAWFAVVAAFVGSAAGALVILWAAAH